MKPEIGWLLFGFVAFCVVPLVIMALHGECQRQRRRADAAEKQVKAGEARERQLRIELHRAEQFIELNTYYDKAKP